MLLVHGGEDGWKEKAWLVSDLEEQWIQNRSGQNGRLCRTTTAPPSS